MSFGVYQHSKKDVLKQDLTTPWEQIKEHKPQIERKRKDELREIINAMFYLAKTGSQWRLLPDKYPKWQLVYFYFRKWNEEEITDFILDVLREKVRRKKGRNLAALRRYRTLMDSTEGMIKLSAIKLLIRKF
ncbi:MAG: transposase [Flavobacteriales bacterium]|nr:transposase [Flavobacteriales bacterium]